MQLVVYCKKCSKRNALHIWANDRVELKMKHGNKLEVVCKKCKTRMNYQIADIRAEQRFVGLISFISLILCIVLLVYFLWNSSWLAGSVYLIPVGLLALISIYAAINKDATGKVRNFNRS